MNDHTARPTDPSPLDEDVLDGHTVEALSDYLDRGRQPRDLSIESSPAAQHALAALSRLRTFAPKVILADAEYFAQKNENWISRILDQIGVQAHAGRDIPIPHNIEGASLSISEGAVRAIIRDVGDHTDGLLVERSRLRGDIETLGAPVEVQISVSTFEGVDVAQVIADFQHQVHKALNEHTALAVTNITIRIHDTGLTDEGLD
ncbi:MAG: hypothetical protein JWQ43_2829 [Glaciihabitans sp.]|nr:hypothetical protein [Glaciihabitans sp.]